MLNTPSTKSIYSKPVKRCFIAPPDHVIYAIDLSALEDRVIASLTKDVNKCAVFLQGLDGHSLNTLGYGFPELPEHSKLFKELQDPNKGKYFQETLSDGTVRYFREFD